LLLREGAGVNAQGGVYGNALQAALLGGYQAIIRLLLQEGADINTMVGSMESLEFEAPPQVEGWAYI
jgi:hypothetical protein